MKVEIRSRWSGALLFSLETESLRFAVEAAVKSGADLRGADLMANHGRPLGCAISGTKRGGGVVGLRAAIAEGRIDGSTYEGDCACLVGTLANVRHVRYDAIPSLRPNSSRPIERFFLAIRRGDTPETSTFSRLALEWTDEWLANMRAAFGHREVAP